MPAPQSTHENPPLAPASKAAFTSFGSWVWTLKIRFELGNRIPRINCARLPAGGKLGAWLATGALRLRIGINAVVRRPGLLRGHRKRDQSDESRDHAQNQLQRSHAGRTRLEDLQPRSHWRPP